MKYTIAIPAFKARFLEQCIESVLEQSYTDFELIIVNDASPENLDDIVNLFKDERIRYFKNQVNCGAENVVDNWNKCLTYSKGDYFLLLGDDDRLCVDCLETYDLLIKKYPELNIYHSRSYIINEQSEIISLTQSWPEFETVYENILHRLNGYRTQFISDFLYKTDTLKKVGGFYKLPLAWASDDLTSYIVMMNNGIAHTQQPLLKYRNNPLTISNTGNALLKLKAIQNEVRWINDFLMKDNRIDTFSVIYKKNILDIIPIYTKNKIVHTITQELRHGFFWNLFKIANNRKQLGVTTFHLFKATLLYLNNRIS